MSKSTRDWLLDAEGSLRPPLDACPLKRNWAAAEVPQVRDVLASGYGPGYNAGDAISIVFEQPTAAGLDEEAPPISRLYLAHISPVSRLYLACISPISRLYLAHISRPRRGGDGAAHDPNPNPHPYP